MKPEDIATVLSLRDEARKRLLALLDQADHEIKTSDGLSIADLMPLTDTISSALQETARLETLRRAAYEPLAPIDQDEELIAGYGRVLISEYQAAHRRVKELTASREAVELPDAATWTSGALPEPQRATARREGLRAIIKQIRLDLELDDASWEEKTFWDALDPWRSR